MMINDMKKNELNELEMDSVVGGGAINSADFLYNEADVKLFASFSDEEKVEVYDQPDTASRRAKMMEIWRRHC